MNFYTDAAYWKAQEGDFDEKTADDWDVDMSVYYEKEAGVRAHDKDAVDSVDMRRAEFLHKGAFKYTIQATQPNYYHPNLICLMLEGNLLDNPTHHL